MCTYRHNVSQNLIEEYLISNLEEEYNRYKIQSQNIHSKTDLPKKGSGLPNRSKRRCSA
mgnify:CR=1 FL=1